MSATVPLDHLPIRITTLYYKEADRSYYFSPHSHRVHQWYVCLHGGMTVTLDGQQRFDLNPEQSLLVPPGTMREPKCHRKAPGYLVAMFECIALDVAPILSRTLDLPHDLREDLLALVEELRAPKGAESSYLTGALLTRLLIGHKRAVLAGTQQLSGLNARGHQEVVGQAEIFMQRNLFRPLARSEIAAAVNLSEPHLARLFKALRGRTILQRLTEMRIDQAKTLLRDSNLSVTQVSGEVGISSFSHFAKVFRKAVGAAPSDYRRTGGRIYG
ncbi:MAG: helix-turn-helix domain-containing protein [Planctomycetes bacterium]|nr:helix-turn-helix domain-containing protein [Planctomycetota bacterium]